MARIERVTEYYVRIDPRRIGFLGSVSVSDEMIESKEARRLEMYRDICEAMVDQIKRHVDEVGYVAVEKEVEFVCDHCGSEWTEGPDDPHNGGCCDTDCDVYEANEGKGAWK